LLYMLIAYYCLPYKAKSWILIISKAKSTEEQAFAAGRLFQGF
jgi:hypothetical protein